MEPTNLQKAIAIANKASQEDQAGNYEEAIRLYQHAVQFFLHIVKREPQGKDGNQKIRDKCKEYLDRVEELKDYLENKQICLEGNVDWNPVFKVCDTCGRHPPPLPYHHLHQHHHRPPPLLSM